MSETAASPPPAPMSVPRAVVRRPEPWVALALLGLALVADNLNGYEQLILTLIGVYAIIGAGLVLLVGVGGQLSLGHAAFVAVGAYSAAYVSTRTELGVPLELVIAIALSTVVGLAVGLPSLRLSGLYLALATLALGVAGRQLLYVLKPWTGGGLGATVGELTVAGASVPLHYLVALTAGIAFLLAHNLLRSRTGRALHASRTAETAAVAVGIDVRRLRLFAFVVSAILTATAGVLYAHAVSYLTPLDFSTDLSILVILLIIIGGQQSLAGAVLGAVIVAGLPEEFRGLQKYQGMIYGAVLVALIIASPKGLAGLGQRLRQRLRRGRPAPPAPPAPATRERVALAPGAQGARLRVSGLGVHYGGVPAVEEVDFEIDPGSVTGLIGPNGAGKTTLFNAVSGIVRSEGGIELDGRAVGRLPARARAGLGVGRTFQSLSLHEDLTPLQHVLVGRHPHLDYSIFSEMFRLPWVGRVEREAERFALQILDALDLRAVANEPVTELPYGLQKRVDVARALAGEPRLLLLDEPAAGLPGNEADDLIDAVIALTRPAGTTLLVIEHNFDMVVRVCERILVMDAGRLIAADRPSAILQNARVVEAYLGA